MEWRIHFMVLGSKEGDRKRQGPNVLPKDIFLMTQLLPPLQGPIISKSTKSLVHKPRGTSQIGMAEIILSQNYTGENMLTSKS